MPPSRIGTVNLADDKVRAYVDEDLNEVGRDSPDATFIFKRHDLDRLRARRKELGLAGDESSRVQRESHKVALADAERRAKAAEEEVATLRARVEAGEKAAKAEAKTAKTDTADDAGKSDK